MFDAHAPPYLYISFSHPLFLFTRPGWEKNTMYNEVTMKGLFISNFGTDLDRACDDGYAGACE